MRDWSGRKPRQYQTSLDNAVSADTFRSKSSASLLPRAKHVTVPESFLIRRESRRENEKFPRPTSLAISAKTKRYGSRLTP